MPAQRLNCSFSLLDEGRQYTGNHRKYIIENAREICNSPATKEKIRLREALGFYGHGRRILAGKMNIGEVEAVTLPDGGKAIVSNIPSNVIVAFDVSPEGVVSHSQEVLDTETGKLVSTLHASRVGGFSWACPGVDGGRGKPTRLSGFSGFDYVLNPGFSSNQGYILEGAADTARQEQMILECLAATVKDDRKAEKYLAGWTGHAGASRGAGRRRFRVHRPTSRIDGTAAPKRRNRLHLKGPMRVRHSGSSIAEGTACRVDRRARLLFPLLHPGRCAAPDDGGGLFPRQNDFRAGVPRGLLAISH